MRSPETWSPSKFEYYKGSWRGSRDRSQVMTCSRLMADRVAAAYVSAINDHASGDLLDLGCGSVPLYGAYRDLVTSVTCVDWANSEHPSPHLDFEADLGKEIPLPDAQFDTVLLTDVLEHLPYPERVWQELKRVMRPGGTLILGVPFLYWLHELPHDYHRYTEQRLRMFCADHGFDVVACHPYGGPTDVLADLVAKLLYHSRMARPAVAPVMSLGERVGRRRANMTSPVPLGYLLIARRAPEPDGGASSTPAS